MSYIRRLENHFANAIRDHRNWPVVISEGDSWFSFADVIGRLDDPKGTGVGRDQRAWALLRLEKVGDEILSILSGSQRANLRRLFQHYKKIDALLFSGGGNDIIGADLDPLLRDWEDGMQPRDAVAFSRFERRLRQIADCYRELLDLLSDAGKKTKVFVNSYDYLIPSKSGAKLLGINVKGPWLLPALRRRRIPASQHAEIVRLLIDAFCTTLDQVASEPRGVGRMVRIETRNLLTAKTDWKDEIHPSRRGAAKVAKVFEESLQREGILP